MDPTDRNLGSRAFGLGHSSSEGEREQFEELTAQADELGTQWRDLTSDGYRVPGDMYIAGMVVRYDWRWRTAELQRRLDLARDQDE
jgi:hypothetical protein